MTSDDSWSEKLRQITELERVDHPYLRGSDTCAYFGNYTANATWSHSRTNGMISNLKKNPKFRHRDDWKYKGVVIPKIGAAIRRNLNKDRLRDITFCPIPPSKTKSHPEYDDRMIRVARAVGPEVDVRELLVTRVDRDARHTKTDRRDRAALKATLEVDKVELGKSHKTIVLLDDVLTTGCSFTVCKDMLLEVDPELQIFGIFVARVARDTPANLEALDDVAF
jgi:predicted amidophosphoribosyltransferase